MSEYNNAASGKQVENDKEFRVSYPVKVGLLILLALVLFASQLFWNIESFFQPQFIESWLSRTGVFAPVVYMITMALAVVISPIPSLPLDIAAGVFFGPYLGTLYSVIGAAGGAMASFAIARMLGREFIERFLGGHVNFCAKCSDRVLTKIVFLSRLIPVVSFDVVSYGAGLTRMSAARFALATVLGMIPLTFVYNYFGSVLVVGKKLTIVLGIVMVILFFLIPTWIERKGLLKKIHEEP